MSPRAGITFFAFVGQRDMNAFSVEARSRLGLLRATIYIAASVVLRYRSWQERCLNALARPYGFGFRQYGW